MDPVEARDLYPITRQYIFMNHAGVSPMSERARAAVEAMAGQLTAKPLTSPLAMEEADRLRESLARLFTCGADHIALTRSTAHGISLLAAGLDWQAGDNVVGARGEYPANVYPWVALGRRGVEFRMADNTDRDERDERRAERAVRVRVRPPHYDHRAADDDEGEERADARHLGQNAQRDEPRHRRDEEARENR